MARAFPVILMIFGLAACTTPSLATDSSAATLPATLQPPTEPASPAPTDSQSGESAAIHPLPPGPLKIVTLGDSLTEGQGDDSGLGGYPARLQALVETVRPGTQVLNLGHSGWAAPDLINGLNGEPSELEQAIDDQANIAIAWIGSNDLWYLYEYGPEPITDEAEQNDLQSYEANIDTILSRLTHSGAQVFVALLDDQSRRPVVAAPPNPAEPAFTSTTADDLARMSAHVTAYNEIIRRKAAAYGAVTVDFYDTDIFTNPATLYEDGNHPNSAGYEDITRMWFEALEPYIK
jgi:lysophospholipase L1-like esterase